MAKLTRAVNIEGVVITLTLDDARALADVVGAQQTRLRAGTEGTGRIIDERAAFCETLLADLSQSIERWDKP